MTFHDHGAFAATDVDGAHHAATTAATCERAWLIPSACLTALLGLGALILMPVAGYTEIPPYFSRFLGWLNYMAAGGILLLLVQMVKLRKAGEKHPIEALKAKFLANRTTTLAALAGAMLAGIDMLLFMWIKPEVTAISPFRADRLFADLDHAIFGTDPWRFFEGLDLTFHAWAYSFYWAVAIMATLVWLFAQRPSAERSASLLSYFAVWSLFGPIGQFLGSAAGPIFYRRVGLGDRFVGLEANIPDVTEKLSSYLWKMHINGELGVGAGISAMPSLHIATVTWIFLVFLGQRSKLAPLAAVFGFYIFALSVALGWHYAVDGIAGALGAVATHAICRAYLRRRGEGLRPATLATACPQN